ncbi:MAG TPA: hypothetical protein VFK13_13505 [Gemmatimonadaceae bacterium]|nr:hypothetical protein [Gemmatimonadaceae bacterium]
MERRSTWGWFRRRGYLPVIAVTLASCYSGCAPRRPATATAGGDVVVIPPPPGAVERASDDAVTETQMRNVDFRLAPAIVLRVRWLRGEMVPKDSGRPVVFDDKRAFAIRLRDATVALRMDDLTHLMNDHVFAYRGSPLEHLRFRTDGTRLVMSGTMHKVIDIPFTISSSLSVTGRGEIRVHPERIKIVGLNGKGLLRALDIHLSDLLDLSGAKGVRVEGNDLVLDPERILPPPIIQGRLVAIRTEPGALVQRFRSADGDTTLPDTLTPPHGVPNYMFFRGGTLRFGKLYMVHADMEIVDADPSDPFDFSLDRYNDQLVAGYSRNTQDHGLVVTMPDLRSLDSARSRR